MRRNGFTLIELLVVIAIIVILAGILYPVFAATRRAAYSAACLSNLKQVGLSVQMYAQDYDETFPTACSQTDRVPFIRRAQPNWPVPTPYLWELVAPYVKNPSLWRCPGDIGFTALKGRIDFRPNTFALTGSSYNYNTDLAWVDPNPALKETVGRWAPLTVSAIQRPADTFISADPAGHWHNGIQGTTITYHQNGVCVDGHAKSVTRAYANEVWNRDRSEF